jgi:hypothetical protein
VTIGARADNETDLASLMANDSMRISIASILRMSEMVSDYSKPLSTTTFRNDWHYDFLIHQHLTSMYYRTV